ncbi:alcohol dehydrogenase catalytic domain-containing protein [Yinghuangia soli]|uniref:2-deoxy-scyllo-inosamine dehydrogenase n=1 Tax=Yinghuangia soli TaxID=2908204 RepID=A0AA41Q704_9ACTN|nr:theronine dehydrogenase [Yinghuangia soli]MCF2532421.1 theronine dehydrogenase [Yinghuangia soli]
MRALTAVPGRARPPEITKVPDPVVGTGELLVQGVALGLCRTDRAIAAGTYGRAPEGRRRLVLGHEPLGRVVIAPPGSGFAADDLVVGVLGRPGSDRQRGIRRMDGYGSEQWTVAAGDAVLLDPALGQRGVLTAPAAVAARAWERIDGLGGRLATGRGRVLVTGAGTLGLLSALMGLQRGLDVHILVPAGTGVRSAAARGSGATCHTGPVFEAMTRLRPDIVVEATGSAPAVSAVVGYAPAGGIACLLGQEGRPPAPGNGLVFGSAGADHPHYVQAAGVLADAAPAWLDGFFTHRFFLEHAAEAFTGGSDGRSGISGTDAIKVVVDL